MGKAEKNRTETCQPGHENGVHNTAVQQKLRRISRGAAAPKWTFPLANAVCVSVETEKRTCVYHTPQGDMTYDVIPHKPRTLTGLRRILPRSPATLRPAPPRAGPPVQPQSQSALRTPLFCSHLACIINPGPGKSSEDTYTARGMHVLVSARRRPCPALPCTLLETTSHAALVSRHTPYAHRGKNKLLKFQILNLSRIFFV